MNGAYHTVKCFSYEIKIQDAKDYLKPKPPEVELPESQEQGDEKGILVATLPQPGSHQVFMPKLLSGPESTVLGALTLQVTTYGTLGKSLILSSLMGAGVLPACCH